MEYVMSEYQGHISDTEKRLAEAEKRLADLEMIASYAQDVVEAWPRMSIKTINVMDGKMKNLKEALKQVK